MRFLLLIIALLAYSNPSHAVINGQAAFEKKYGAIGSLKIGEADSAGCTATLITEKWIVTAAHCLADGESEGEEEGTPLVPADFEFRVGADFAKPEFRTKLKRWVSGPKVNDEELDIAFGELEKPVPLEKLKIQPMVIRALRWNAQDLESPYIHIGYGVQEAFGEDHPLDNKRQQARLRVTSAKGNALLNLFGDQAKLETYLNTYHPESIEAGSLEGILHNGELLEKYSVHAWDPRGRENLQDIVSPLEGWQDTCFGDSGGPLLKEVNGKISIVGVVSHGMDRICSPFGTKFVTFGPKVLDVVKHLNSNQSPDALSRIAEFFKRIGKSSGKSTPRTPAKRDR